MIFFLILEKLNNSSNNNIYIYFQIFYFSKQTRAKIRAKIVFEELKSVIFFTITNKISIKMPKKNV